MAEGLPLAHVLAVLSSLDGGLLRDAECWFGGGTAVSIRCGGYRLSGDVDFLCANADGYRSLRKKVFDAGFRGLFGTDVEVPREARADQYGIRGAVRACGSVIKVEIVREARVDLVGTDDVQLPVSRLADVDLVAEKLLANADRFLDDATLGRDALDLLMLEHTLGGLPGAAWDKARRAYDDVVDRAFERAIARLAARPVEVGRAMTVLGVVDEARAVLERRLAAAPHDEWA